MADGTYTGSVVPQSGQQFWAAHYRAAVVDGSYNQTYAFSGSASSVQLHGLVIKRFTPARQKGAVESSGTWTVADTELASNGDYFVNSSNLGGAGIHLGGCGWTITRSYIHDNGEEGAAGGHAGCQVTFTNNEVSFNNRSHQDWGFEAGGTKFWGVGPGTVITGNNAHDNDGPGLWIDSPQSYQANGYLVSNNTTSNNNGAGINIEVSTTGMVSNNVSTHDGAYHSASPYWGSGCINIGSSQNVTVSGNTCCGGTGLAIRDEHRTGYPSPINNHFSNNTVIYEAGWSNAFVSNATFPSHTGNFSTLSSNSFVGDHYQGYGTNAWFYWLDQAKTWAQWQAAGQDTTGSAL